MPSRSRVLCGAAMVLVSLTAGARAQVRATTDAGVLRPRDAGAMSSAELSNRERTYITELTLVIDGARRLVAYCEAHADEKDLAKFARPLAERYVELANRMLPSNKLVVAHPHMLLVVENIERALDAAAAGDGATTQKRLRIARDELANLEAVMKQLKLRTEPGR